MKKKTNLRSTDSGKQESTLPEHEPQRGDIHVARARVPAIGRAEAPVVFMNKISILGLGYIGLPTALIAATHNFEVTGFDTDPKKIFYLKAGLCPIIEPGLQELLSQTRVSQAPVSQAPVSQARANKKFHVSNKLQPADCFIIAVPTPITRDTSVRDKKVDLSYVLAATRSIAKKLAHGNLILLESTVPVGTTQKLAKLLEQETGLKASKDFYLAHCPERVLPGRIIKELVENDRIIGGICQRSSQLATEFYKTFVTGDCYQTDDKSAEMVKLVENSSRDVQIAFANQVAGMCEQADIDPFKVIELANKHPRVNLLKPGCGVGGHCIAVDPWFLIEGFPEQTKLLKTARETNDSKPGQVIEDVIRQASALAIAKKQKPTVLALGLTFKPDVDDMRESPALQIAQKLAKQNGLNLLVCEPNIEQKKLSTLGFTNIVTIENGLEQADIVLALVPHTPFKKIDQSNLRNKIVIDPCGLFEKFGNHETTLLRKGHRQALRGRQTTT